MSYKVDTDVPEVLGGKLRQYSGVDRVIAKGLFELLQPKAVEPRCDVHARLPDAITAARLIVPRIVGAGEYLARLVAAHGQAAHHAAIAGVIGLSGGQALRRAGTLTRSSRQVGFGVYCPSKQSLGREQGLLAGFERGCPGRC